MSSHYVRILGDDGTLLATVESVEPSEYGAIELGRLHEGKAALMRYYFSRGGRVVTLDLGEVRLPGTLQTRWVGSERRWVARLRPPVREPAARAG
jgi:hypothetical protein